MVEGGRKGGLIHFGAADIFTLISILQLKANKLKEYICTSELEVQTLPKAHTDTEQICIFSGAGLECISYCRDFSIYRTEDVSCQLKIRGEVPPKNSKTSRGPY